MQATRAVTIYIDCYRKLYFWFSVLRLGVQLSELQRKTDHLFGDVNHPALPLIGRAGMRAYVYAACRLVKIWRYCSGLTATE
jgi:hypothetical protein